MKTGGKGTPEAARMQDGRAQTVHSQERPARHPACPADKEKTGKKKIYLHMQHAARLPVRMFQKQCLLKTQFRRGILSCLTIIFR